MNDSLITPQKMVFFMLGGYIYGGSTVFDFAEHLDYICKSYSVLFPNAMEINNALKNNLGYFLSMGLLVGSFLGYASLIVWNSDHINGREKSNLEEKIE